MDMTLIFHQAALGDFVLILPLQRSLRGEVAVVTHWSHGRLATQMLGPMKTLDAELLDFARLHSLPGPRTVSPAVGELLSAATTIISFVSDGHDAWAKNVERLAPQAQVVCLPTRPPAEWKRPVGVYHRKLLLEAGLKLAAAASPITRLDQSAGPWVVHPGSGGRDKCWPMERFEALLMRMQEAGLSTQVIYGEAEAARWPEELRRAWAERHGAECVADLPALVNLLAEARGYLGNDSGPTHLAAVMGLPTVALFGPTDPRVWRPQGSAVTVVAPPTPRPMDWLDAETAWAGLSSASASA